ncbi:MAG: histidine phosphatase family protein [Clostridia bacterium]|nr:histidine phosphatase family protein [Clostridia bacterium]
MACRLIFIRHGQSLGNKEHIYLGHTDLDLSEMGYEQAFLVGEFLKTRKIDKIYSSDLMRAYNTSLPLAKCLALIPEKREGLREIFAGEWENKAYENLIESYPVSYGIWQNDVGNAHPDGGESVAELQKRIINEVVAIANENDGKTVAIFTHATPIRSFFAFVRGLNTGEIKNMPWATNASVSEAEFSHGEFREISYSVDAFLGKISSTFPKGV